MKKDLEILNKRFENLIENMLDVVVTIQEIEQEQWPAPHLSDRAQISLSMCFMHILWRNCWDKLEEANLTKEQRLEYVKEVWEMTHEHMKNLYNFNSKKWI